MGGLRLGLVHLFTAKDVVGQAAGILAERTDDVLHRPHAALVGVPGLRRARQPAGRALTYE